MSLTIIEKHWKAINKSEEFVKKEKGDPEAGINPSFFFFDGIRKLIIPIKYRSKKGKKGEEKFTKSYKEISIYSKFCPFSGKPLYKESFSSEAVNLTTILHRKAFYPVRIIAQESDGMESSGYNIGDELGIETIDFSAGLMRVCNKNSNFIFELYYEKASGELKHKFEFKPID